MKDKDDKEKFEKFNKKLIKSIDSTSSAKVWSDLLPIMKDIQALLTKYFSYNFDKLKNKENLAKRLAQGLNPECPSGLHEVTLDVYELLLKNLMTQNKNKLADNLYLYAYGLFPFFPNATIPNKINFLEKIVNNIFMNLNKEEFKLCLPGLLSSLIPGLDDNNDKTTKLIYKAFDKIILKDNGELERDFFGVYWMLLLRCQHLRNSGIKYLLEKNIKYSEYLKLDLEKKEEIKDKQFPNLNTIVVNALCEIIKDKDIPTVRNGMDFVMTRLPLSKDNDTITDEAKINLIISGLNLLIKNEYSTVRRLNNWILGLNSPEDEIVFDSEDMKYKMKLVIKAFEIIFKSNNNIKKEILLNNIKIIKRLFESQEEFINLILPDITYNIVQTTVKYWEEVLDCIEYVEKDEVIDQFKALFNINDNCFKCLWNSLADSIKNLSEEINPNNLYQRINEVILPLKFCLIFIDMKSHDNRIKYYIPIISNLLIIIKNFPLKREDFKYFKQIIIITLAFIKSLQELGFNENKENNKETKENNQEKKTQETISSNYDFEVYEKTDYNTIQYSMTLQVYNDIINKEENNYDNVDVYNISDSATLSYILKNNENNEVLNDLNNSIKNFQNYYIKILVEYSNIKNELTKYEIFLFEQYAEIMIRLQEYVQNDENEIPLWVKHLEKLIFGNQNTGISNEAAKVLINLNLTTSLKSNVYSKIRDNFKSEKIDNDIIEQSLIEPYIKKMKNQTNCFELLLAKYYFLLNQQSNYATIMELLFKLYLFDEKKFIELIYNTFVVEEELSDNIKLFCNFWKLVNEYEKGVKIVLKKECIFKMVDLLENKNPLLRHLSKTWLNQANQQYTKIINPILFTLVDKEINISIKDNNSEFSEEFDTSIILDSFLKLKNLILNCPLMSFLRETKIPDELFNLMQFKCFGNENNICYWQALISISLHYIKTKSSDKLNEKFKKDIFSTNAASCEFLEFLLENIDNKFFLYRNHKIINETILVLLNIALKQKDEVMPTQLLGILKSLYFSFPIKSIISDKNMKKDILGLFKNKALIQILTEGITNDHFYIREHFISFSKKCVETFISIITIEDTKELKDFYHLCNQLISPLSQLLLKGLKLDNKETKEDTENYSHYDKKSNKIIFKNYCEEYKEYKKYDENDIVSILEGINNIVSFCFKNEILEKSNKQDSKEYVSFFFIPLPFKKKVKEKLNFSGDWKEYKKELANNLKTNNPFLSFLNDLSTVIIDYTDEKSNSEITDISTNLYQNQILNLLNSFLSIWINQSDKYEIFDYCLNSKGVLPYVKVDSLRSLKEGQIQKALNNIKNQSVFQYIISMSMNLFRTDSIKFVENLLQLWCQDESTNKDKQVKSAIYDKQYKLSIIELLITMDIPIDVILFCVGWILQNQVTKNKNLYKKKNKIYETPINLSIYEAKIFHFIYSYILLNPKKYSKENDENIIIEIWKEIINILNNSMNNTKIIYSVCWMYEIMQLASEKFCVINIDNRELKSDLESLFSNINSKLMEAVFSEKYDSKYQTYNKLVLPILPHAYSNIVKYIYNNDNLYQKNIEGNIIKSDGNKNDSIGQMNKNNITLFLTKSESSDMNQTFKKKSKTMIDPKELANSINNEIYSFFGEYKNLIECQEEANSEKLNDTYKNLANIILKENFYSLIKNCFDDNLSTAKKYYTEMITKLLNVIKKKDENHFRTKLANEFLVSLMESTSKNMCLCGKSQLMDFVKSPDLFSGDLTELHGWKIIISKLVDNYPEILNDLIDDMDDKNIFVKKTEENKMDTLRRISFVIYSCDKDKFSKDFGLIKKKAKELLTEYNENTLLEKEIFLIMRMLFLRFSHDGVMQMIRDLWPIIFTELINNILRKNDQNHYKLLLETFKFIELLSLVNIEEFSLYQWIFMLDTFDLHDLDVNNKNSLLSKILDSNDLFRPLSFELIKEKVIISDISLEGEKKGKSELYIRAKNMESLKSKIMQFCYSIGDMNSYKVEANYTQIEKMIENDFNEKEGKKK